MALILSLDDSPEILKLMSGVLGRAGYQHVTTSDDFEAWALLHTLPVDLFTQDIQRPLLHGGEFVELLRADPALAGLPILILSGLSPQPAWDEAGIDGYVMKPFSPGKLAGAVAQTLQAHGRPLPPGPAAAEPDRCLKADPAEWRQLDRPARLAALRWLLPAGGQALPAGGQAGLVEWAGELLADPDPEIRLEAARLLGRLRDGRAIEPLRQAWASFPPAGRWAIARALGQLKAAPAAPLLLAALAAGGGEDELLRLAAILALGEIGEPQALEPLLAALAGPGAWVPLAAAVALGRLGDGRAIPALVELLASPDDRLRRQAAAALTRIGGPAGEVLTGLFSQPEVSLRQTVARVSREVRNTRLVPPLIAALADEDAEVRRLAAAALGEQRDPRAVEPLIAALADPADAVAAAAAEALAGLADRRAVGPLLAVLQTPRKQLYSAAITTLGHLGDHRAAPALLHLLNVWKSLPWATAALALARIGGPALAPLLEYLGHPDPEVRRAVAAALADCQDRRVVRPLLAALRDPDPDVVRAAAQALSWQTPGTVLEPLLATLQDPHPGAAEAAALALSYLNDPRAQAAVEQPASAG